MKKADLLRGILFFIVLSLSVDSSAFGIPERLVFDLTWSGIKAGAATLEIIDGVDSVTLISTAHSSDWISTFYTVDDRIETVIRKTKNAAFIGSPQNYRVKLREGRYKRDKEVIFDHGKLQAFYLDHLAGGEKKSFDILANTLDPLSSLYYVRTMKFEVGKSLYVDIFDSKKMWNVEVQVLKKERVETRLGTFNTILIKPLMKSEGIFNRKGDMYIWLTDDSKRIPVKMQSKVAVGYVTATLISGNY